MSASAETPSDTGADLPSAMVHGAENLSETTVHIPRDIFEEIDTERQDDMQGVLFFSEDTDDDDIFVEEHQVTGIGDPGSVQPDEEGLEELHRTMEDKPDYRGLVYHTHSRGTLEEHGREYGYNFSHGDMPNIESGTPPRYEDWQLLFTPDGVISSEEWMELSGSGDGDYSAISEQDLIRYREEEGAKPEVVVTDGGDVEDETGYDETPDQETAQLPEETDESEAHGEEEAQNQESDSPEAGDVDGTQEDGDGQEIVLDYGERPEDLERIVIDANEVINQGRSYTGDFGKTGGMLGLGAGLGTFLLSTVAPPVGMALGAGAAVGGSLLGSVAGASYGFLKERGIKKDAAGYHVLGDDDIGELLEEAYDLTEWNEGENDWLQAEGFELGEVQLYRTLGDDMFEISTVSESGVNAYRGRVEGPGEYETEETLKSDGETLEQAASILG